MSLMTDPDCARIDRGASADAACAASQANARRRTRPSLAQIVGDSPALTSIRDTVASIAPRRCTVLLQGETGTGKEMLARHLHVMSDRVDKPFVPVDCSGLTESLFESQLFGHARGAFTGAVRDSLGFVRAADGGTLFLDEVGELPLTVQAKLLRVLQERAVVPVGETTPRTVDVRIVCATHRDLRSMVSEGMFREDLYFRLNVVTLHLPPLRERPGDVIALADHFLALQAELYDEPRRELDVDAVSVMMRYPWPGNVRELANAVEHAHVLARGESIGVNDLPERVRVCGRAGQSTQDTRRLPTELCLADLERRAIAEALRRTRHNKAAAARMLGINIQRLGRRMEKLGVVAE